MGVEPVAVDVRTRDDAEDPELVALLGDVGLVYLSGGDPHYLAETLEGTPVWEAVVAAWRSGAALAGCSAGAMALSAGAPAIRSHGARVEDGVANGLGAVRGLAVIPHFDQMERWRPGVVERYLAWRPPGTVVVGVDEDTALVAEGDGRGWRVEGRQGAWLLDGEGRRRFGAGEHVPLPGVDWA